MKRTSLPLTPKPSSDALTRAYFRALRAAEMATWEMTGGDYLRSTFVGQSRGVERFEDSLANVIKCVSNVAIL